MTKKNFCKNCKKEIEQGKEVKIKKGRKWISYSSRYSSSRTPREVANYYLCWECYDKEEQELAKRKGGEWKRVLLIGGGVIVLILGLLFFWIWKERREDARWKRRWKRRRGDNKNI